MVIDLSSEKNISYDLTQVSPGQKVQVKVIPGGFFATQPDLSGCADLLQYDGTYLSMDDSNGEVQILDFTVGSQHGKCHIPLTSRLTAQEKANGKADISSSEFNLIF